MIRILIIAFVAFGAMSFTATAQNTPVYQSGLIPQGHTGYWIDNGVVGDAGPASAGNLTELGITNTGTPFCINDLPTTNPSGYQQFCLGASSLGGGLLSYQPYNGALALPFTVNTGGPLIFTSQTNDIEAKNLPLGLSNSSQLCVNPTTGVLSVAANGVTCGGGPPPSQALLLNGGGFVLLNGGGRILLN